ncbi:MAG: hypothetical protein ACFFDF_22465 [Candidatus Odinarchaeota archaeon]
MLSLPNKSINLHTTDPPFNVGIGASSRAPLPNKRKIRPEAIVYKDKRNDYDIWCFEWFKELKRICDMIIIYCTGQNLPLWIEIERSIQILYRISKNIWVYGKITYFRSLFPLVCYGEFKQRLIRNLLIYHSKNRFLMEKIIFSLHLH